MHDISGFGVNLGINAVDLDVAVGLGRLDLGGTLSHAAELGALGVGHQTLASLSGNEVSRLLAGVLEVAVSVQSSEVAVGCLGDLVGLLTQTGVDIARLGVIGQSGVDGSSDLGGLGVVADAQSGNRLGDVTDDIGSSRTFGQSADILLQVGDGGLILRDTLRQLVASAPWVAAQSINSL